MSSKTIVKTAILVVLFAALAVILQYQYGRPGETLVERLSAKPVVLDFDGIDLKATPVQIQQIFHNLKFTCTSEHGNLGDHVCWAPISEFQTVNARIIAFFFRKGQISAVRVSFSPENHPPIFSLLNKRYGPTRMIGGNRDSYGNNIVGWVRPTGIVAINDNIGPNQEAILLWTSRGAILSNAFGQQLPNRNMGLPGQQPKDTTNLAPDTLVAGPTAHPKIRNYEAPGNLESKHDIDCVRADRVENKYTPTDLYRAMSKCVGVGKYTEAAFLFAVASVYGHFDTFRVTDKSAHQAESVARMQVLSTLDRNRQATLKDSLEKALGSPEGLTATCKEIARIGPPNYYPRYMIQHGMGAFINNGAGDGLSKDFDANATWKQLLNTYLHCPGF